MKKPEQEIPLITAAIVDDEEHCVKSLIQYLSTDARISVTVACTEGTSAIEQILIKKPDLLFLDIELQGMNGFDVLEALNRTSVRPYVIFVTAFEGYSIRAIRASAFDYLLKPVLKADLVASVERFLLRFQQQRIEKSYSALLEQSSKKRIRFNTAGGFIVVDPGDIVYVRADWNYSEIFFDKNEHDVVVSSLGKMEEILPKNDFARINRSVIINIKYLDKVLRGRRLCILKKNEETFEFKIPLQRIRELEAVL